MKHIVLVEIDTDDAEKAGIIRDEIAGAVEDFTESHRPAFNVSVGDLETIETDRHAALVELAKERHCSGSSDEIECDSNARLSEGCDGIFVQGWLFVPNRVLHEAGIDNPHAEDEDGD